MGVYITAEINPRVNCCMPIVPVQRKSCQYRYCNRVPLLIKKRVPVVLLCAGAVEAKQSDTFIL